MWKHNEEHSEEAKISLHDCKATRAFIESEALYFEYENGFWCLPTNKNNPYNDTLKTDLSQLKICNFEAQKIYLFDEYHVFNRLVSTKRRDIDIETLIENLNNEHWQLEFLYAYHTYRAVLFECCIWMNKKPYHKECQITLSCDNMEYLWNDICADKPW